MNLILLIISLIFFIFILFLTFIINYFYKTSLTNIDIKERGLLYFYQMQLDSLFRKHFTYRNWSIIILCWIHYILLHLFSPLFFASFLLKNDWNVLIAIFSIIISMNLFQKVYPANLYSSEQEEG
ncbi:MAG: hypothetical protein KatS3mg129_1672 [Leptospiraceae bacterium]|nr:MAG: hypothetical protein KatS3mg129_1672 [Leptospiraceae bacterium]